MAVSTRKPTNRRRRRVVAVVLLVVLAGAAVTLLWLRRGGSETAATVPQTTTVSLAPFRVKVSGPGTLAPARSVALTPTVSGRILSIASVGDRAQAGDALAALDPATFQRKVDDADLALQKSQANLAALQAGQAKSAASVEAQVSTARADVDSAQRAVDTQQRSFDLTSKLFQLGSASQDELNSAKDALSSAQEALTSAQTSLRTQLQNQTLQRTADEQDLASARVAIQQAQLTLDNAREDLAATTVLAPFSGVVSSVDAQVGEVAGGSSSLLTLVDDDALELDAQIAETDIAEVRTGQAAEVTVDAMQGATFTGTVTHIAPTATLVSNIPVFYVTVEVQNADHALRGGMTGTADIVTREVPKTFQVPSKGVVTRGDATVVRVQQPDGSYRPVPVQRVASSGLNAVLTGDVPDGAVVLVSDAGGSSAAPSNGTGFPGGRRPNGAFPVGGGGFGDRRPRRAARGAGAGS